ncbi:MAG: hypothetical protein ACTSWN_13090 [Promethearchaeota archaeon]
MKIGDPYLDLRKVDFNYRMILFCSVYQEIKTLILMDSLKVQVNTSRVATDVIHHESGNLDGNITRCKTFDGKIHLGNHVVVIYKKRIRMFPPR